MCAYVACFIRVICHCNISPDDALEIFRGAVLIICQVSWERHISEYLALKGEHRVTWSVSFPLLHLSHDLTLACIVQQLLWRPVVFPYCQFLVLLWSPLQRLLHSIVHVSAMSIPAAPPLQSFYCRVDENTPRSLNVTRRLVRLAIQSS